MKKPVPTYHHGDLKNALVTQASTDIENDGLEALSLRKVGSALGVSQAALYKHFADKKSLLEAIAVKAYDQLIELQKEAHQRAKTPLDSVELQGEAYVQFAIQHPHLYRLMFGMLFSDGQRHPELQASRKRSFALLQNTLNKAYGKQSGKLDAHDAAVGARVMAHGLASLVIDGTLSPGKNIQQARAKQLVRQLLVFYCNGLGLNAPDDDKTSSIKNNA